MCLNPLFIKGVGQVPCRKCVECRVQYSSEWALRCMLEAKKHDKNCFITLTYNDANLPDKASVKKRDLQLFIKRLRKYLSRFAIKIRFFACGEYGSKGRPHYHAIIFGWFPDDARYFCTDGKKQSLYLSKTLATLWTFGYSSVGVLTFESAKYCAKYMQKSLPKNDEREKPFVLMSRRPGLALDVIPETVFREASVYFNGQKRLAPRSFLKVFKRDFPNFYDVLVFRPELDVSHCIDKSMRVEVRRKKYKKIFGNLLDENYILRV